jgi:hypothetical protein
MEHMAFAVKRRGEILNLKHVQCPVACWSATDELSYASCTLVLRRTFWVCQAATSPYTTTLALSKPNTTPMSCSTVNKVLPTVTLIRLMNDWSLTAHARRGFVRGG